MTRTICVLGGAGFIGHHVVRRLAALGLNVRVPVSDRERAKGMILLPTVDVVQDDAGDGGLARAVAGCDAVINLTQTWRARDLMTMNAHLPRRVADACRAAGVTRMLHLGALGAGPDSDSPFLRSVAAGEVAVRDSGLVWTLLRPAPVFGRDDGLLAPLARAQRWLPLLALPWSHTPLSPVYVNDVAEACAHALDAVAAHGRAYTLCGPRRYTLAEWARLAGRWARRERFILPVSGALAPLAAWKLEHLPGLGLAPGILRAVAAQSGAPCELFPFGITPTAAEAVAPTGLGDGDVPSATHRDTARYG